MSSTGQSSSPRLAVSRPRHEDHPQDHAEVIDLVHLPRGTRPTPIAYLDYDEVERLRHMDCEHYARCLTFAASVKWRSFHCRQCPKNPDLQPTDPLHTDETGETPPAVIIKIH